MMRIYLLFIFIIYVTAVEGIVTGLGPYNTSCSTIFLRFYNGTTNEYNDYYLNKVDELKSQLTQGAKLTIFFHGYMESVESDSVLTVVSALLSVNQTVIAVDYSSITQQFYPFSACSTNNIANCLNLPISNLVNNDGTNLHLIGFSLGCHIIGALSAMVNFKISQITGLDPANLFNLPVRSLNSNDANFVDIIHSDFGCYGISKNIGDIDFYPNGGHRPQLGCPTNYVYNATAPLEKCDHYRSYDYYAESITRLLAFPGVECDSQENFNNGKCNNNSQVYMGYSTPTNAKGTVFLVTNGTNPYGIGEDGAGNSVYNISKATPQCEALGVFQNLIFPNGVPLSC